MTDQQLKNIFSEKLGNIESPVSANLWSRIESAMPAAQAVATTTVTLATKLWIAAASIALVGTVVALIATNSGDEKVAQTETQAVANAQTQEAEAAPVVAEESVPAKPSQPANGNLHSATQNERAEVIQREEKDPASTGYIKNEKEEKAQSENEDDVKTNNNSAPTNTTAGPAKATEAGQPEPESCNAIFNFVQTRNDQLRYFFMPQFTDAATYHWTFGNEGQSDEFSPVFTFNEQGKHVVTLTTIDNNGKSFTEQREIEAYLPAELAVPNIFTPNGDGNNDVFDVTSYAKNMTVLSLSVFDKNNKLVFESNQQNPIWDGTDRYGSPAGEGTYIILVSGKDLSGRQVDKKGTLTLKRG